MTITVTLCTLAVTAPAGCAEPGQATWSAAAQQSPAESQAESPAESPAPAMESPAARETLKPGTTPQPRRPQTTAAGKVTGLSVTLVNDRQEGYCPGRVTSGRATFTVNCLKVWA